MFPLALHFHAIAHRRIRSWLYNLFIGLFQGDIQSAVESSLEQSLQQAIDQNAEQGASSPEVNASVCAHPPFHSAGNVTHHSRHQRQDQR